MTENDSNSLKSLKKTTKKHQKNTKKMRRTYGTVLKARHKQTGLIVAIKRFKESDEADERVQWSAFFFFFFLVKM
jgi:hypothetical protein